MEALAAWAASGGERRQGAPGVVENEQAPGRVAGVIAG
jgi:hypothetical protein